MERCTLLPIILPAVGLFLHKHRIRRAVTPRKSNSEPIETVVIMITGGELTSISWSQQQYSAEGGPQHIWSRKQYSLPHLSDISTAIYCYASIHAICLLLWRNNCNVIIYVISQMTYRGRPSKLPVKASSTYRSLVVHGDIRLCSRS